MPNSIERYLNDPAGFQRHLEGRVIEERKRLIAELEAARLARRTDPPGTEPLVWARVTDPERAAPLVGPDPEPCGVCGEPGTRHLPTGEWSCDEHLPDDDFDETGPERFQPRCDGCREAFADNNLVILSGERFCPQCAEDFDHA